MREPNYQEALSHSWQMVKDHKILWIFGLLSVCLGQWGLANFIGGLNLASLNDLTPRVDLLATVMSFLGMSNNGGMSALFVVWLILIVLAVLVLVVFVAVVSRGALIASVGHWFAKDSKVSPALAWRYGVKCFWEILSITILTRILEVALLLFTTVAFIFCGNSTVGFVAQSFFGMLALAVGLAIEAVAIFASGYVVIDGASIQSAIMRGWNLFTRHILVTLELGILMVVISLAVTVGVALASFVVFIPAFFIWSFALVTGWSVFMGVGAAVAACLFLLVVVLTAGIFSAFNTSAWMYLFIKMHRENYIGWVLHRIKKLFVK